MNCENKAHKSKNPGKQGKESAVGQGCYFVACAPKVLFPEFKEPQLQDSPVEGVDARLVLTFILSIRWEERK